MADFYKLPYIDLEDKAIRRDILTLIPEQIATTHEIIAFDKDKDTLLVAMADPENLETLEFIKKKTELATKVYLSTPANIRET